MALPETSPVQQEIATPEATEPTQAPQGQAGGEPQETPKYVTEEQLAEVIAKTKRDMKESDKHRTQLIRQEVEALKQRLEVVGIPVTPEQESKLYNQVADSIDNEENDQPSTLPSPEADIPAEILPALDWMKRQGVIVNDNDPEFTAHLKPVLDTPKLDQVEISLAMAKAVEAKRARMALQQGKAPLRTPTGGGAPATETFTPKDARDLWKRAHK